MEYSFVKDDKFIVKAKKKNYKAEKKKRKRRKRRGKKKVKNPCIENRCVNKWQNRKK